MAKVWLVTGSGNGLGRDIVEAALAAGDNVVAGARKTAQLDDLVQQYGDQITPVALEVRDESAARAAVTTAVSKYGRLDVLVNNAGYGVLSPFEQLSSEDFQAVIDTCLNGVVYTTRAAVPVMRKQRSGRIFQVSSIGGRMTMPGNSPYHAAKWAVGGFSHSVAAEVAPFGVQVCTLEPGGIRTNWLERFRQDIPEILPDYDASVGKVIEMTKQYAGKQEGDPKRIAQLIVKLANAEEIPIRLILGIEAEKRVEAFEAARSEEASRWRDLGQSTVFENAETSSKQ